MYYPSSENKGADQLRGYREADLRLCFRICRLLVFTWGGSFDFDVTCEKFLSFYLHMIIGLPRFCLGPISYFLLEFYSPIKSNGRCTVGCSISAQIFRFSLTSLYILHTIENGNRGIQNNCIKNPSTLILNEDNNSCGDASMRTNPYKPFPI